LARERPEFQPGGRSEFFGVDAWTYWGTGKASGFLPPEWWSKSLPPLHLLAGALLPLLLLLRARLPDLRDVSGQVGVLAQVLLASSVVFLAAHAVLFHLYLPAATPGSA
jgi:hypothetical protein